MTGDAQPVSVMCAVGWRTLVAMAPRCCRALRAESLFFVRRMSCAVDGIKCDPRVRNHDYVVGEIDVVVNVD